VSSSSFYALHAWANSCTVSDSTSGMSNITRSMIIWGSMGALL
jgi:hypothetical protein